MIVRILLALYAAAVALIAFWPAPVDQGMRFVVLQLAAFLRGSGLLWLQYEHIEFSANVLLFIPLGLLVTLVVGPAQVRWFPPLSCLLASMVIELVQFTMLQQRFPTLSDVIANTVGGALGWLIALGFRRVATTEGRSSRQAAEPQVVDN